MLSYHATNKVTSFLSVPVKGIFVLFILSGLMQRKFILKTCLRRGSWGVLEMFILLTDDIIDFDMTRHETWDMDTSYDQLTSVEDIYFNYSQRLDSLLSLLTIKCPVSFSTMTSSYYKQVNI